VDRANLAGNTANFIEQEGAIALTAVHGVDVDVLHIARTSKSAVADRGVLIFDQQQSRLRFRSGSQQD
jgi:hypothetical protein